MKVVETTYQNIVMTASTTTEYPETVKVISLFKDEASNKAIQVVSIFNKKTSEVKIIETESVLTTKNTASTEKQVFTSSELATVQVHYPSIPATTIVVK